MSLGKIGNIGFINLQPLLDATFAIQAHVVFALISFVVGAMILWRRKGGPSHKKWGKFWVLTMGLTALTSFFINEIRLVGLFSPIHLISVFALVSLYMAIKYVRAGNISLHQRTMKLTYVGGMLIAGGLTFLPGRIMHQVAIDPFEAYLNASKQGASTGISVASWFVVLILAVLVVLILNRKMIINRLH